MEKHAIVTGGSRGLGLALTKQLLRRGTSVTILDSQDASHALPVLQELACEGASVRAVQVDLASHKEVEDRIREAEKEAGPVDLLAATCGDLQDAESSGCGPDQFARCMSSSFLAAVHSVQSVLPGMLERGRGSLLLQSSVFAVCGLPGSTAAACSGAAVKAYADVLRLETLGTGVSVHVALAGDLEKYLASQLWSSAQQMLAWMKASAAGERALRQISVDPAQLMAWLPGSATSALPLQALARLALQDPDQITAGWLTAAKQGAYVLPSSALSKALARLENGLLTPGSLWWPLEASVAPAQALLRMVVRKSVEVVCRVTRPRRMALLASPRQVDLVPVRSRRQWLDNVLFADD